MRKRKIAGRILTIFTILFGLGAIVYMAGPRPTAPKYPTYQAPPPAASLAALETELAKAECAEPGIKDHCEARIVWADSLRKQKTPIAFVYYHGFGASPEEGAPTHTMLAKQFGCNLLLARLDEHGTNLGDNNMASLTADSYIESAERMLAIGKQLGDAVVLIGTSAGGAVSLFMASRHSEVKALVTWSPCIRLYSGLSAVLAGPWGLDIAQQVKGGRFNDFPFRKPEQARYWTNHQRLEGIVQFAVFLETAMVSQTFAKIHCPVFVGYYYKDEDHQDQVVSVPAMQQMASQLGTSPLYRRVVAFPEAGDHVIGSEILSNDWQGVLRESSDFLKEVVGLPAQF